MPPPPERAAEKRTLQENEPPSRTRPPSWMERSGAGVYKVGKPYKVNGIWYFPREDLKYDEVGYASWYGEEFHDNLTANGEAFNMDALSAAHKTLPLPSVARVTNLENGRSLILRVNDRGPFVNDRILDVSRRAAKLLGFADKGTAKVRVELMPEETMTVATQARNATPGATPTLPAAESGEIEGEALPPVVGEDASSAPADDTSSQPGSRQPDGTTAQTNTRTTPPLDPEAEDGDDDAYGDGDEDDEPLGVGADYDDDEDDDEEPLFDAPPHIHSGRATNATQPRNARDTASSQGNAQSPTAPAERDKSGQEAAAIAPTRATAVGDTQQGGKAKTQAGRTHETSKQGPQSSANASRQNAGNDPSSSVASGANAVEPIANAKPGLYIQVGAFSQIKNAQKVQKSLARIGEAHVYTAPRPGGRTIHLARIGPFSDSRAAQNMLKRTVSAGHVDAKLVEH